MEPIKLEERALNVQVNALAAYRHLNVYNVNHNIPFIMVNAMRIALKEHTQ